MFARCHAIWTTLMLLTDIGNKICWRQSWDFGDGFGRFRHQYPLSLKIGYQHLKDVTSTQELSSTSL